MRRILPFLFLALTGCSNAPVAGFLDNCFPSRAKATSNPNTNTGPGVDVRPGAADPIRPAPPGPAGPLPPPDFGP